MSAILVAASACGRVPEPAIVEPGASWQRETVRRLVREGKMSARVEREVAAALFERLVSATGIACTTTTIEANGCLYLFLFSSNGPDQALAGTCAYLGDDVVLCDEQFLFDYLYAFNAFPKATSGENRWMEQLAFARWILAHEIAHAALGHDAGHFVDSTSAGTRAQEEQADEAAAFMLGVPETALDSALINVFNSAYLNSSAQMSLGGVGMLYGTEGFPDSIHASHPHLSIRAARLLRRLHPADGLGSLVQTFLDGVKAQ